MGQKICRGQIMSRDEAIKNNAFHGEMFWNAYGGIGGFCNNDNNDIKIIKTINFINYFLAYNFPYIS